MKNNAPLLLVTLGLNLLSACGTEIGNGRQSPTPPAKTSPDKEDVTSGSSDSPVPETSSGVPVPMDNSLQYLLIACGSPIPDLSAATFKDAVGTSTLTVTVPAANSWTLKLDSLSSSTTVTKNATASSPNGIASSDSTLGSQTCSQVSTSVSGGITEKKITYSDNYKTTWTIDGMSRVTSIKVQDDAGTLLRNFILQ